MSELEHSPEPWRVDSSASSDRVFDADGLAVCKMVDWSDDARLIAAAPDMLRMLRVLSEKSESGADTKDEWYVWRDAMQEAKELIARLDGGK